MLKNYFFYFLCIFLWFKTRSPWHRAVSCPGLPLKQIFKWNTRHRYQISSILWFYSRRILNIFQCISMVQTQDSLCLNHFIPGGHHLNKLGKGLLGRATYRILSTCAKWLRKRIFLNIFSIYFLRFKSRSPGFKPI